MKPTFVGIFNAIVIILLGLWGYLFPPSSPTALISVAIGIILLLLSIFINKNKKIFYTTIAFTGISLIIFFVVGILRANSLVITMAVITLISLVYYLSTLIKK